MLHVCHPPSQLLADGVVRSLRETTHPFHTLPVYTTKRPIEVSAKRTWATRGWRAPWSKGCKLRSGGGGGVHPPIPRHGDTSRRTNIIVIEWYRSVIGCTWCALRSDILGESFPSRSTMTSVDLWPRVWITHTYKIYRHVDCRRV